MTFKPLPKGWLCDGLACYRVDIGRDEPDALGPQEPVKRFARPRGRFFFEELSTYPTAAEMPTLSRSVPVQTFEVPELTGALLKFFGPDAPTNDETPEAEAPGE